MLDLSRFKVISFDCYGTLVDWESGILSVLQPLLASRERKLEGGELLETFAELEAAAEAEYKPYREVLKSVVRGFGEKFNFTPTEEEQNRLPESIRNWQPFPDTVDALRRLKQRYELAIISNIDDDLFAATAPNLAVTFDHVITAQQAKCYKPGVKIFEIAERRVGVPRDQWLHAAQSIYHDIIPAKSLGISTVWVNRISRGATKFASATPDVEVWDMQSLAERVQP